MIGCACVALAAGLTGSLQAAEESFSQAVRAEDFSAAGLAKLSAEELARLDALVRDYKSGALLAARRETAAAEKARAEAEARATSAAAAVVAAKVEAEARAAKATADAQAAQAAAEARAAKAAAEAAAVAPKKSEGGLLAKAKALLPAGTEVEYAAVESRIAGDFTGWEGRTVFVLENGQRWQVVNGGSYFTPALRNPAVKITPASFGGFWLTVEGVKQRVRVARVDTDK